MTDPDRWLAERHWEMTEDLSRTLDLETGLAEVTIPERHEDLVSSLTGRLELDRGLTAILPRRHDDAAPAGPAGDTVTVWQLADVIAGGEPGRRLRARPSVHALATSILEALARTKAMTAFREFVAERLRAIGDVLTEVDVLAGRIREQLGGGPRPGLEAATERAETEVGLLSGCLTTGGLGTLQELHHRTGALESALSEAVDVASDNTIALLRDMHHAAARSTTDLPAYRDARRTASDLEHHLRRGLRLAGEVLEQILRLRRTESAARQVHQEAAAVATSWGLFAITRLETAGPEDAGRLLRAVDDFVGADLENADVTGVALDGIRWSDDTRWPGGMREVIRSLSVPVSDGVYEIQPHGEKERAFVQI